VLLILVLVGLNSCSDDPTSPEGTADGTTGRLQIYLVDAPAPYDDLESLEVIFSEVKVHAAGKEETDPEGKGEDGNAGWITVMNDTLPESARTFDLLELVGGVKALLGDFELPAGHYTQLRIIIEEATVHMAGETYPLTIPSGAQSGLKLVGGWYVPPDGETSITLDFDVNKSLIETPPGSGNFLFKPTIRMLQTMLTGTISGTVTPSGIGAVVSAYDADADTLVTSAFVDTAGAYVLHALTPGEYDVEASASGYETARTEEVEVEGEQDKGDVDFVLTPLSE